MKEMITGSISLPFSRPVPLFTYLSLVGPTFMMLLHDDDDDDDDDEGDDNGDDDDDVDSKVNASTS